MNQEQAAQDLALVRRVLEATQRRVDPQMFHFIIWGVIVLVWYPLDCWLDRNGGGDRQVGIAIAALVLGCVLSMVGGFLANRRTRLPAGDPTFAMRIASICWIFVGTGAACTIAAGVIGADSRWMPHLWGLIYALMLMVLGALYAPECFWLGLLALAGTLWAAANLEQAGYIIGGTIGPAAIVAGLVAEYRVRRLQREAVHVGEG